MDTQASEWVQEGFNDLADDIRNLEVKHNQLVESLNLLWGEIQRTASDPLTRQFCTRRIDELTNMLHDDRTLEKQIPSTKQRAWD